MPPAARGRFLERLFVIRDFLATQDGCEFNRVAESRQPDGSVRLITMVEWRDREAMNAARANAAACYEKSGFDPRAFMAELGIEPDFGLFEDIPE